MGDEESELNAKKDAIIERQQQRRRSQAEVHEKGLPPGMAVPENAGGGDVDGLMLLQGDGDDEEKKGVTALVISTYAVSASPKKTQAVGTDAGEEAAPAAEAEG